jgi:hypothetical protein
LSLARPFDWNLRDVAEFASDNRVQGGSSTMADDREEAVRRLAFAKWESEGKPEGQHERHWQEAEAAVPKEDSSVPQTSQAGEDGHVALADGKANVAGTEERRKGEPKSFKPGNSPRRTGKPRPSKGAVEET